MFEPVAHVFRLGFVALREDVEQRTVAAKHEALHDFLRMRLLALGCSILHSHLLITFPSFGAGAGSPRVPLIPVLGTAQGFRPRSMNRHRAQIAHSFVDCIDMHLPILQRPPSFHRLGLSSFRNSTPPFVQTTAPLPPENHCEGS
jgi:hypothetical protein